MTRLLAIVSIICVIGFVIIGFIYYFFFISKSGNILLFQAYNHITGVSTSSYSTWASIKLSCNSFPMFPATYSRKSYYAKLFNALDTKIYYDASADFFISPSGYQLSIVPLSISTGSVGNSNNQSGNLFCWVAVINYGQGAGKVAYETKDGKTETVNVKDLPQAFPTQ